MAKTTLAITAALLLISLAGIAPGVAAKPDLPGEDPNCPQVYPWSEVCEEGPSYFLDNPVCNDVYCLA